jgi:transposase
VVSTHRCAPRTSTSEGRSTSRGGSAAAPKQSVVKVGIETDRGPWVAALVAAGYEVFPINPLSVARYRERHSTSGAKSDAAGAHLLAEIVRLDRAHHRPVAGDTAEGEAIKLTARTHQSLVWDRTRRVLRLRSTLREYFPVALRRFLISTLRMRWSCSTGQCLDHLCRAVGE